MSLKRTLLLIALFGSLIGFNETLIGGLNIPYRSVLLSAITLSLLALARFYLPKTGTSFLIIIIAILFKVNSYGIQTYCTPAAFLCGPTVLLMLGTAFELFAYIFINPQRFTNKNYILCCTSTAILVFTAFGLMNTFILKSWDTSRLYEYIFLKGSLTAIVSSTLSLTGLYAVKSFKSFNFSGLPSYFTNSIIGSLIVALWIFGYYIA